MFLLTYMYQNIKNIKYIYYIKIAPGFAPKPGDFENVAPAPVFALAPHFRSRSQVTLSQMMLATLTVSSSYWS